MTIILLVRHGQNNWVEKNRLAGWTPGVHLNDKGHEQVTLLAERLIALPIKAIYSSPLVRCMETAQALAQPHGIDIQTSETIGEVRYGRWEGKKIKKLAKKKRKWFTVQHYPSRFRFPGGESFPEVQERAVSTLEVLSDRHAEETIIVVSHGDVIKLLLAYYLGLPIDMFQRIVVSPASVSILALGTDGPARVLRMNDAGPIQIPKNTEKHSHPNEEHSGGESADKAWTNKGEIEGSEKAPSDLSSDLGNAVEE